MPVTEYMETVLWQPIGAEANGSWSLDRERQGLEKMFVGVTPPASSSAQWPPWRDRARRLRPPSRRAS